MMADSGVSRRSRKREGCERQCELCYLTYQSSRSLNRHLSDKHRGHPRYREVRSNVPTSPAKDCPHCGRTLTNLREHVPTCPDNPKSKRYQKSKANKSAKVLAEADVNVSQRQSESAQVDSADVESGPTGTHPRSRSSTRRREPSLRAHFDIEEEASSSLASQSRSDANALQRQVELIFQQENEVFQGRLKKRLEALQTRDQVLAKRAKWAQENGHLEKKVKALEAERDNWVNEKEHLEKRVKVAQAERDKLEHSRAKMEQEKGHLQTRVKALEGEREELKHGGARLFNVKDFLDVTIKSLTGEAERCFPNRDLFRERVHSICMAARRFTILEADVSTTKILQDALNDYLKEHKHNIKLEVVFETIYDPTTGDKVEPGNRGEVQEGSEVKDKEEKAIVKYTAALIQK